MIHKLLRRQLEHLGLSSESLPTDLKQWQQLLEKISKSYVESDQGRYLMEHSLQISSREMQERWDALKTMEEQWRSLSESAPDLILMLDLEGYVSFANRGRGELSREQMMGRHLRDLFLPPDRFLADNALKGVLGGADEERLEIKGYDPNGRERWYSQRIHPVLKDGKILSVLLIESDVTENIELAKEIELERSKALQTSKMATLGEMAGGIAHEINSPLAAIQLMTDHLNELIKTTNDVELQTKINRMSDQIRNTVQRISKVIKGLRAFARDSNEDPFEPTSVALILEETLDLTREKMKAREIRLEVDPIAKDLLIECRGTQVSQVLMNLLSNAIDAQEKVEMPWILIQFQDLGEDVLLRVLDGGPGIPLEIRNKIMNPFFTTKDLGKGTGLGLSISKGLAEAHGGQLRLNPNEEYTCFELRLPKRQPRLPL